MSTLSLHQSPLGPFVDGLRALLASGADEARIVDEGRALLAALVARDDWLPDAFAQPDPERYRQYLLHLDPDERFSVVSFVWGPGQSTPIHNHTVWGLIGMLRGGELSQPYRLDEGGRPVPAGDATRLRPGDVEAVSPRIGDIHRVTNAFADRVSISIHVYGANIGKVERAVFLDDGTVKPFVSGYSNP
ncbi:cysteine dioxygenase [Burkholderia multivorans]|uniref:cysteine dioxygenase family protein n=1 Tax=Burkholderia multivorans TaxID=87883 RepID=UPI002019A630|nr:cysteine dioxygenase [Burkholderia multivorans]UQP02482.1 cysteine dioxygenase [Burkholderia multivorans]